MRKEMMPFQVAGAEFLAANPHALLADQPGLGKTIQSIRAAELVGARNNLVLCPASVRTNWRSEIRECLGEGALCEWKIMGYETATEYSRTLADPLENYDALILDEAHFLKTVEAKRTQAVFGTDRGLARRAGYIWPMTGTPVLNRPRELFPILRTLHPAFSNTSFAAYAQRYCGAYFNGRGIDTRGATHVDELSQLLDSFMLRRTKNQVFPGRVEPLVEHVPLDVKKGDLEEVFKEEQTILDRESYLSPTHEKFAQLGDLARLLRLTGEAKARATAAYVDDLLETVPKVTVAFYHHEVGRKLYEALSLAGRPCVAYQGGMTDRQKDIVKERFMRDESCRVFLGQITAAGTGINGLQEVCSDSVVAEQPWVPGVLEQWVDRHDRMNSKGGMSGDLVTVRVLYAEGTLEGAVIGVRKRKGKVIEGLMRDDLRDPLAGMR